LSQTSWRLVLVFLWEQEWALISEGERGYWWTKITKVTLAYSGDKSSSHGLNAQQIFNNGAVLKVLANEKTVLKALRFKANFLTNATL
jgi:hypothetical protein